MGQSHCGGSEHEITAATLNFSGINTNRFEYDDGSKIFQDLNRSFKLIQEKQFPNMTKWKGINLDKNYKTNRFTVLFGDELIQSLEQSLFTKQQFQQLWKQNYRQAQNKRAFAHGYKASYEEVQDVMKMDYVFYRAVVMAVYGYHSLQQYQTEHRKQQSIQLKTLLLKVKGKAPFQLHRKKQLVQKYYQITDIMFLQEAGSVQWNQIKGFTYYKNSDSMIIYKTEVFGESDREETNRWRDLLNINQDSVCVVTQKKYLLLSCHFKSSEKEYMQQEQQLKKALNTVFEHYHRTMNFHLVAGMDSNHFLRNFKLNRHIHKVPNTIHQSTSIKKRSFIQAQLHKADLLVNEVKDHIITTLPIESSWLEVIDGNDSKQELLPCEKHPYDHFVVKAKLKVPRFICC